jgi:tetratricopeptide (TPR) repeat protein
MSRFQAMNQAAQLQKLVAKLKTEPYILILDNLESVTGQRLAIQNTLSKKKQTELREFLALLVGGKTRVVLGSRSSEEWLQGTTFKTNIYHLQGLDPQSRSLLAEKILERHVVAHRISKIRDDEDFARLMKLLAGYPLAMEVVLANLKQQSPKEILEKLQAADVNLDSKRESGDKTESILKCVEYSHSNLSADAQKLLLCLAPFSGFIWRDAIPNYVEELQSLEPFKDYAFDKFDAAIQEAINWGLLSALTPSEPPQPPLVRGEQEERFLRIQPVFPYFLKTKLGTVDEATREALREAFKNHYQGLAVVYQHWMNSKDSQERQWGQDFCQLEYENLYPALQTCLERQENINIFFCLDDYFHLRNDPESGLNLAESICQALENYSPAFLESEMGCQVVVAIKRKALNYLHTKQYQLSKQGSQSALDILQSLSNVEEADKKDLRSAIYHCLGRVEQELRNFEEARYYFKQSLQICKELDNLSDQGACHHELGIIAQELREFPEAIREFKQVIEIAKKLCDRSREAVIYYELGIVALNLQEFQESQEYFQEAMKIFVEFGDSYSQTNAYNWLGVIAEELKNLEEARCYYQKALEICIEFGYCQNQAHIYRNLGNVAIRLKEFEEAKLNYKQALEIYIEFEDRYTQHHVYYQLGNVAQELCEFTEAHRNYQQALEIQIEFGDRYAQADTYGQLGLLAAVQEDYAEARANLQKALEIYVEYQDEYWGAIAREALERLPDSSENQD